MFHSHVIYSCQIWAQNNTILRKLEPLQNKAMRIINFKNNEYNVNELYKTNKILKIADYIKLLNCLFVRDIEYIHLWRVYVEPLEHLLLVSYCGEWNIYICVYICVYVCVCLCKI